MKYEIEHDEGVTILSIKNEKLDSGIAPKFKSRIIILANAEEKDNLIIDMSSVEYADSSGISGLLMAHRLYRDSQRRMVICGVSKRVMDLIKITRLDEVLSFASDRETALHQLMPS
ncbi:MAG TPA: STAS domain-containing protein [Balneolales bacterium]|jgi:anti-anti-sigma factor|nr:STAS domain-containing protein [Balneolales bacterium]